MEIQAKKEKIMRKKHLENQIQWFILNKYLQK